MASDDKPAARKSGEEFQEYVRRLERQKLKASEEFTDQLGDALDLAAAAAKDALQQKQAEVAAKAMRAAAEEFRLAAERMERGDQ